ncbi:MAG: sugar ABC transporter permease [Dehalococcoidia bacterium]|nr:sugar ABC transporter permease [Dehalococcoidia bacterium]
MTTLKKALHMPWNVTLRRRSYVNWRETGIGYLYILPALAVILIFHFLPIFYAFYISLFNWRIKQGPFIGLANYETAIMNPDFWGSIKVTIFYAAGIIPATLALSFLIAYALFQRIRGRNLYRMMYFLPFVTATVAAALVWRWIFHSQYGILNFVLGKLGVPAQGWLLEPRGILELAFGALGVALPDWAAGPSLALVSIIIFTIWRDLGFGVVVMLAGLSNISSEVYDAARVDGAGEWTLLRNITIPLLSPTLFFLVIVSTIEAFQSFNPIYIMTDPNWGGPLNTTLNATMYIFQNFFQFTKLGYASAVAFVLFFIVLGLTILQIRVLGRRVHYN